MPGKRPRAKCAYDECEREQKWRGLCHAHYSVVRRLISKKKSSWKGLEAAGKIPKSEPTRFVEWATVNPQEVRSQPPPNVATVAPRTNPDAAKLLPSQSLKELTTEEIARIKKEYRESINAHARKQGEPIPFPEIEQ